LNWTRRDSARDEPVGENEPHVPALALTAATSAGSDVVHSVDRLSKTFAGQRALDNVDLTVRTGEIHAIVGQNGSGKSTLVKVLAGYHKPNDGADIQIAGSHLATGSLDPSRDGGLRFVHQDLGLIDTMAVSENFRLSRTDR
jgi:ribose transport system ATP-binding protein